jgi:hypothetical protein
MNCHVACLRRRRGARPTARAANSGVGALVRPCREPAAPCGGARPDTRGPDIHVSPLRGGLCWWFICPRWVAGRACRRRVRKLYPSPGGGYFACRRCCRLSYTSQRQDGTNRALSKAQAIRKRLGGSAAMLQPSPPKPKGMRWKTYRRLRAKSEELWSTGLRAVLGRLPD